MSDTCSWRGCDKPSVSGVILGWALYGACVNHIRERDEELTRRFPGWDR